MEEYKSNSHKSKVEKVVTSPVKAKKKSELSKLADIFISEDATNVKSYVLMDVLVPAIKKAISDIVTNGIDMILYGTTGVSKKSTNSSRVSYRSYYDKDDRKDIPSNRTTRYSYDDIVIESRGEAEKVLDDLDDLIERYKMASVGDFYDLVGITPNHTDYNYGWTDIRNATVVRIKDGYIIKLPKALPLN